MCVQFLMEWDNIGRHILTVIYNSIMCMYFWLNPIIRAHTDFTKREIWLSLHRVPPPPPPTPKKTQHGTVDFQDLLWSTVIFSPCWIEYHFPIIITPRSSNLVENFSFYEYFLMDWNFRDSPDFTLAEFRVQQQMRQHIPAFNQLQRNLSANDVPGL